MGWLWGAVGATGTVANSLKRKAVTTAMIPSTMVMRVMLTKMMAFLWSDWVIVSYSVRSPTQYKSSRFGLDRLGIGRGNCQGR